MARVQGNELLLETQGRLLVKTDGAIVTITESDGVTPATVYAAATGGTTISQPLTTEDGMVVAPGGGEWWLDPGVYVRHAELPDGRVMDLRQIDVPSGVDSGRLNLVEAAVDGVVNVRQHGVYALGLVVETSEMQAALDAAEGKVLLVPDGIYLHGPLTVPSGTTVLCSPGAIFKPQTNASAILFDSPTLRTPTTSYQLTVDSVVGALTITVSTSDAANLAAGDRVTLRDATYTLGSETVKREMNVVKSVNTGTGVITLEHPVGHVYTAANDSWIAKVTPATNIHWVGGQADCDAQAGGIAADVDFIEALYPENCVVEGLTTYNHADKAVHFYCGLNSHIRDCNAYSPDLVAAGEGYNAQLQYSRACTIEGGWSRNIRHHADIIGGQACGIIGGFTIGRTSDDQIGAFLHGMESRWCFIRGFTAENVDVAAAAGNPTFAGDFDFTIEDVVAVGCGDATHESVFAYKSTGRIVRPKIRNPQGDAINVTNTGADVDVIDPDIDMGTSTEQAIATTGLVSGSKYRVRGGTIRYNAVGTPVSVNVPTGAEFIVDGTTFAGTMTNAVALSGASVDQVVTRCRFRGTIGEAVRVDDGEVTVTNNDFGPTGITTAIRLATNADRVTQHGNKWGTHSSRVFNNSVAGIVVGTTKLEAEGTAAPTTGTWAVGDRCWNTSPAAGGTPGWVCTTAGGPGTWKAMAAVAA